MLPDTMLPVPASLMMLLAGFCEPSRVSCILPYLGRMARFMPVRYDQDTKAKAIRLVREHAGDYPSEYAAITAVARRLGMTPETLRKWIRQAAVDEGQAPGVTTEAAKEIRELKRKVSELERTIEILSAAAGFFAREHDPLRR